MNSKLIYLTMIKKCPNTKRNKHYLKRYIRFINSCYFNKFDNSVYTEKHHILPKGKNFWPEYSSFKKHPWNKIVLSARQHYIAHKLLALSLGGWMWYAFKVMMDMKTEAQKRHPPNSKDYELARNNFSLLLKQPKSEEHKKKIGESNRFPKKHLFPENFCEEMSNRMRQLHLGKPKSEEHKKKIGESHKGRKLSAAGKLNIINSHYSNDPEKLKQIKLKMSKNRVKNNPVFNKEQCVKDNLVNYVSKNPETTPYLLGKYYNKTYNDNIPLTKFKSVLKAINEDRF